MEGKILFDLSKNESLQHFFNKYSYPFTKKRQGMMMRAETVVISIGVFHVCVHKNPRKRILKTLLAKSLVSIAIFRRR